MDRTTTKSELRPSGAVRTRRVPLTARSWSASRLHRAAAVLSVSRLRRPASQHRRSAADATPPLLPEVGPHPVCTVRPSCCPSPGAAGLHPNIVAGPQFSRGKKQQVAGFGAGLALHLQGLTHGRHSCRTWSQQPLCAGSNSTLLRLEQLQ